MGFFCPFLFFFSFFIWICLRMPFAGANKIPLRRDWALALLTVRSALLTLRPVLPPSGMDMYSDFCIAIIIFEIHCKVRGDYPKGIHRSQRQPLPDERQPLPPCRTEKNPPFFLYSFASDFEDTAIRMAG
jgi:hypothetical protein